MAVRTVRIQTVIFETQKQQLDRILGKLGLSESEWLRGAAEARMRRDKRLLDREDG